MVQRTIKRLLEWLRPLPQVIRVEVQPLIVVIPPHLLVQERVPVAAVQDIPVVAEVPVKEEVPVAVAEVATEEVEPEEEPELVETWVEELGPVDSAGNAEIRIVGRLYEPSDLETVT